MKVKGAREGFVVAFGGAVGLLVMFVVIDVFLAGCGGPPFTVGSDGPGRLDPSPQVYAPDPDPSPTFGEPAPVLDAGQDAPAVVDSGVLADSGAVDSGTVADSGEPDAHNAGPTCTTTPVPMPSSYIDTCGNPYGTSFMPTIPAAYIAVADALAICSFQHTPAACACAETYNCACMTTQTGICPAGAPNVAGCTTGDVAAGVPLQVQCQ